MDGESFAASAILPSPSEGEILGLLDRLGVSAGSNLIAVLQEVQGAFGYLPARALEEIGERMRIPLSRVYGVVSFYAQFSTRPRGRHTIRCCRGTACHVKGSDGVIVAIRRLLGVGEGETTPDGLFSFETVGCLGICFLAPAMVIDDRCFARLTPTGAEAILRSYGAEGR